MVKKQPPLVIERLEGELAFIKYHDCTFNLPRALLPRAAREGDVVKIAVVLQTPARTTASKGKDLKGNA
ncbi:MAG: DUF3006 domain-containing protein [Thermoanaerobacteraceae bacterium]|uniref:DUF3006 domain-containing protein n=1 Tax=Thermanaeromonas sp. C210 TaxID=2731925 RepID=UPI00155D30CE|nr:DUF3006 domain-containing protein [Thermanaeromonas sp. C210]MBE3580969.1 DUF3006 domain-containing protein [Thermoanaerobacteraceae bacterium]GFN23570.1 hypothetical protein TAMC210_18870 [Thermanaeromonas sp. C210]